MAKLSLNSIPTSVFRVSSADVADNNQTRANIVGAGRLLAYEYARKGTDELYKAMGKSALNADSKLTSTQYKELNEKFRTEHLHASP